MQGTLPCVVIELNSLKEPMSSVVVVSSASSSGFFQELYISDVKDNDNSQELDSVLLCVRHSSGVLHITG